MPISKYAAYMENSTYFVPYKWATYNQSNPFTSAYPFYQHRPQFYTVQTLGPDESIMDLTLSPSKLRAYLGNVLI